MLQTSWFITNGCSVLWKAGMCSGIPSVCTVWALPVPQFQTQLYPLGVLRPNYAELNPRGCGGERARRRMGLCSHLLICSGYSASACLALLALKSGQRASQESQPAPRSSGLPTAAGAFPAHPRRGSPNPVLTGSLLRSTPEPPPIPPPSEQTHLTPARCSALLLSKASRKEQLILSKPQEGR